MAGTLSVQKIQGLASSATPTVVEVSNGHALHANTLKGTTTAGSITVQGEGSATTNLQQGLAKAWANFDESNSTIRDNLNVTDLTDNGTGYFTVNLTNAMGSDDYVRIGNAGENADTGGNRVLGLRLPATNSFNINTRNSTNGNLSDTQDTCVAVLGDLA